MGLLDHHKYAPIRSRTQAFRAAIKHFFRKQQTTVSPELVDASIYVIDVAGGDKVPRKGGPGVARSELLVVNKTDLASLVGADLSVMEHDARYLRGETSTLFTSVLHGDGMEAVVGWVREAVVHRRWVPVVSHMEVDHHDHPHAH